MFGVLGVTIAAMTMGLLGRFPGGLVAVVTGQANGALLTVIKSRLRTQRRVMGSLPRVPRGSIRTPHGTRYQIEWLSPTRLMYSTSLKSPIVSGRAPLP